MVRTKVKGTKFKAASSPDQEPDFYSMPPVVVTPHHSDEELSYDSHRPPVVAASAPSAAVAAAPECYAQQQQPMQQQQHFYQQQQPPVEHQQQQPMTLSYSLPQSVFANNNNGQLTFSPLQSVVPPPLQVAQPQSLAQPHQLPSSFAAGGGFIPFNADRVLDEAVDELFLNEAGNDQDNLADFVNDWDPSNSFGEVLNDDAQLGFMLDKLLED